MKQSITLKNTEKLWQYPKSDLKKTIVQAKTRFKRFGKESQKENDYFIS